MNYRRFFAVLVLLALPLFASSIGVRAQNNALQVDEGSVTMRFGTDGKVIAQHVDFYETTVSWKYVGEVSVGHYIDIVLDKELTLHPNTMEHIPNLEIDGEIVAMPSIDGNTIRYKFIEAFPENTEITGSLQFNNSIKSPLPGNENANEYGQYKTGYVQTLTYVIGGVSSEVKATHRAFPTVTPTIYYLNSWAQSTVINNNVYWNPVTNGRYVNMYLDVYQAEQYQWMDPNLYNSAEDLVLTNFLSSEVGTYHTEAGLQIHQKKFNPATFVYDHVDTRYFSYDDIGYEPGSENFEIVFADLGYDNPKDPFIRYNIEFFINYQGRIDYKFPDGSSTNHATLTYKGAEQPHRDDAFWFPVSGAGGIGAGKDDLANTTSLMIRKVWDKGTSDTEIPSIEFILYADGEIVTLDDKLIMAPNQTEIILRNLTYLNSNGKPIVYTVEEIETDGYKTELSVEGNRFTFTNTFNPDVPVVPEKPTEPVDPTDPVDPVDPTDPVDPVNPTSPETLPQTGVSNQIPLYGLLMLLSGSLLVLLNKKKQLNKK